ncbi:hypothetical protein RQP46_007942 [Phenoliferia psychrophenolica]
MSNASSFCTQATQILYQVITFIHCFVYLHPVLAVAAFAALARVTFVVHEELFKCRTVKGPRRGPIYHHRAALRKPVATSTVGSSNGLDCIFSTGDACIPTALGSKSDKVDGWDAVCALGDVEEGEWIEGSEHSAASSTLVESSVAESDGSKSVGMDGDLSEKGIEEPNAVEEEPEVVVEVTGSYPLVEMPIITDLYAVLHATAQSAVAAVQMSWSHLPDLFTSGIVEEDTKSSTNEQTAQLDDPRPIIFTEDSPILTQQQEEAAREATRKREQLLIQYAIKLIERNGFDLDRESWRWNLQSLGHSQPINSRQPEPRQQVLPPPPPPAVKKTSTPAWTPAPLAPALSWTNAQLARNQASLPPLIDYDQQQQQVSSAPPPLAHVVHIAPTFQTPIPVWTPYQPLASGQLFCAPPVVAPCAISIGLSRLPLWHAEPHAPHVDVPAVATVDLVHAMTIDSSASAEFAEWDMTGVEVELDLSASLNEVTMGSSASVEVNIPTLSASQAGRASPDDMTRWKPYQRPVVSAPEEADDHSLIPAKFFESVDAVLASMTLNDSAAIASTDVPHQAAPADPANLSALLDLLSVDRPTATPVPDTSTAMVATTPPPPLPTRPSFFLNPLTILPPSSISFAEHDFIDSTEDNELHDLPSRTPAMRIVRPQVGPYHTSSYNFFRRSEKRSEENLLRDMKQWDEPGAKEKREAQEAADRVAMRAARKAQREADRARDFEDDD